MVVSLDATKEHVWEIANLLFLVLEKFDNGGKFQENHPVPSLSIEHLKHIYQKEAPIISTDIAGDQKIFPSLLPSILLTWAYRRASFTCHLGVWSLSGGRSIFLPWAFAFVSLWWKHSSPDTHMVGSFSCSRCHLRFHLLKRLFPVTQSEVMTIPNHRSLSLHPID